MAGRRAAPGRRVALPRRGVNPAGPTAHTHRHLRRNSNAESDALAHGLAAAGIARGTRTALMVPPSPDFFALTFALFKVGAVPVLIDPGMGVRNLGTLPRRGRAGGVHRHPEGPPRPAAPRLGQADGPHHRERRPLAVLLHTLARASCANPAALAGRSRSPTSPRTRPAAILFTSGSTGVAKGAVYTHGIFAAQVEMLKATYGIEPGEVDLCTFPLFALFGPALGHDVRHPGHGPDPPGDASTRAKAVDADPSSSA